LQAAYLNGVRVNFTLNFNEVRSIYESKKDRLQKMHL